MNDLTTLLAPNPPAVQDNDPLGFRGDFVNVERHNGHAWIMVGDTFFARIVEPKSIPQFWAAYCRGLAAAREVGRSGIG